MIFTNIQAFFPLNSTIQWSWKVSSLNNLSHKSLPVLNNMVQTVHVLISLSIFFAQSAWTEKNFVLMKDGMELNAPVHTDDVSEGVLVAQCLEHPSGVTEVVGSKSFQ